jgi:hypothetical protein
MSECQAAFERLLKGKVQLGKDSRGDYLDADTRLDYRFFCAEWERAHERNDPQGV